MEDTTCPAGCRGGFGFGSHTREEVSMSVFGNSGRTEIVLDDYPRAPDGHTCSECGRGIHAGEVYNLRRVIVCGRSFTRSTCVHCARVARAWIERNYGSYFWGAATETLADHDGDGEPWDILRAMRAQWRDPATGALITLPEGSSLDQRVTLVRGVFHPAAGFEYVVEVAPGLYVPNSPECASLCRLDQLELQHRSPWLEPIADHIRDQYPGATIVTLVGGKVAPWSRRAPWAGSNHGETVHTAGITLEAK